MCCRATCLSKHDPDRLDWWGGKLLNIHIVFGVVAVRAFVPEVSDITADKTFDSSFALFDATLIAKKGRFLQVAKPQVKGFSYMARNSAVSSKVTL